ncbi:MAG: D-2-hydroxyacid dehydrogenase [Candidatus Omnitrophica bacterium]|nr:D-2-hydroxyacid dehydrogenase [Candidatus Omnitrophota bacterium]
MQKTDKPRIVFLDAATVDYGDLDLSVLVKYGKLRLYPLTRGRKTLLERIRGAGIVITNKCVFDREVFAAAPELRLLALTATGTNNVDLAEARRRGVAVCNVAGYSTRSVAELTLAMMLALNTRLVDYAQKTPRLWPRAKMFTLPLYPYLELEGRTLGIIGYGQIGRSVARMARLLGMKVLAARMPSRHYGRHDSRGPARVSLAELARRSDVVSIHAPLTESTRHLVGEEFISRMKKGAFLINMARGPLWDEAAVCRHLKSGHLGGAASDVFSTEPPPAGHPLLGAPRLLLTPHIAWAGLAARRRLVDEIGRNISAFLGGKSRNRVA